jgi:hypothetical protein
LNQADLLKAELTSDSQDSSYSQPHYYLNFDAVAVVVVAVGCSLSYQSLAVVPDDWQ